MDLTPEQLTRYSRHFILPEIGEEGQKKLLNSKVLLIGAGGLGSPLGLYLSAAGVGTIGLVDFDVVAIFSSPLDKNSQFKHKYVYKYI